MKIGDKIVVEGELFSPLSGKTGVVANQGPNQFPGEITVRLDDDPKQNYYFLPKHLRLLSSATSRHPNSERFHELLKEAGTLHDRKQADYGKGDDPFANVRASEDWEVKGWVGAMIRLNDKVKRLQSLAHKGSLANESALDSFMDIAVYALIAHVLYEQETATSA